MIPRGRKIQLVPSFNTFEFVTCLWIACTVLTLVASHQHFYIRTRYGKRHEPRADVSFIAGSRYGRSDVSQKNSKWFPKSVELKPREDRSFWVTRYGKRSPLDYRTVSSVNRFSAVLDFMDRAHRVDLEQDDDKGNNLDILS